MMSGLLRGPRSEIVRLVTQRPGMSVPELAAAIQRDPSTVDYHARRLARHGVIVRERRGRCVVVFANGYGNARARALATLSPNAQRVLDFLRECAGPMRAADVARWLCLRPGIVRYALKIALRKGVVRRVGVGKFEVVR